MPELHFYYLAETDSQERSHLPSIYSKEVSKPADQKISELLVSACILIDCSDHGHRGSRFWLCFYELSVVKFGKIWFVVVLI